LTALYLLGMDFGTGGAKACLIDDQARVLSYAFREYAILHAHPGWSEHDPENYWQVARELFTEVIGEAGCAAADIGGIAISSALPSMVLVDQAGTPVAPAINLMDRRATDEVELIKELIGDQVMQGVTANRIEDHPSLVNLYWYQRNRPDTFARVHKALTIDGFVVSRLTGKFTLNSSAAVFYGVAFDIRSGTFREDLLDMLGVPPSLLPELFEPTDVIGEVTTESARASGLAPGTPVAAGQVDCNAGWIAGGAITAGDAQLNLGTCGVLGVVHSNTDFLRTPEGLQMVNIPYTTTPRDTFSAVAVTTTGGQALRYLRDTFGTVEIGVERQLHVDAYDLLTLQARNVPAGSEGLVFLPYLMGERAPIWDTSARGVLLGLSLHHHRGHVFRAFLEGVAYALYDSFSVLRASGLEITFPLVFNEGGAKSDVWRRIITDVLGVPSVLIKDRTGAPLGDAMLAGVAVGVFPDFSVAKERSRYVELLEPDDRNHQIYQEFFDLYKSIYTHVQDDFKSLQSLLRRISS
jgi:ribulokinase